MNNYSVFCFMLDQKKFRQDHQQAVDLMRARNRGHFEEYFYDDSGALTAVIDMVPGGTLINIPACQWHSLRSLESGTVLLECKDGPWAPLGKEGILQ